MPIDLPSELTDLRRAILTMGATVEQRVNLAVQALLDRDVDVAERVRRGDDVIDQMDLDIEAECLRVLALSHPVAGDLRFVLVVLRVNNELERIGDMARSIAKRVIDLNHQPFLELPPPIVDMAKATKRMLSDALAAFVDSDTSLAQRIRAADDRVDDLQKEVFVWVRNQMPRQPDETDATIDVLSIARKLERIADICTSIAEDVIFLKDGSVVRHKKVPSSGSAGGPTSAAG